MAAPPVQKSRFHSCMMNLSLLAFFVFLFWFGGCLVLVCVGFVFVAWHFSLETLVKTAQADLCISCMSGSTRAKKKNGSVQLQRSLPEAYKESSLQENFKILCFRLFSLWCVLVVMVLRVETPALLARSSCLFSVPAFFSFSSTSSGHSGAITADLHGISSTPIHSGTGCCTSGRLVDPSLVAGLDLRKLLHHSTMKISQYIPLDAAAVYEMGRPF